MRQQTPDERVLADSLNWCKQDKRVTLLTLVKVYGSGPRKPGTIVAISDAQEISGSVSGGCIEDDLISRFKDKPASEAHRLSFGISREQAAKFQLPCGAQLELIAEPFNDQSHIEYLLQRLANRERFIRAVNLDNGEIQLLEQTQSNQPIRSNGQSIYRCFGPKRQALVIGANDISRELIPILEDIDYQVFLCEPRIAYRNSWHGSINIDSQEAESWLDNFKLDHNTIIIFLSHDAKIEDLAILKGLRSDVFYIGAMGSKKTTLKRQQRLIEHFNAKESLFSRLDAPIGLDLKSKTAVEIAIAIVAKLIQLENNAH